MTALTGFLVLVVAAVIFGIRTVETNLERNALGLLSASGQNEIEVEARGRDLTISGPVDIIGRDDPDAFLLVIPTFLQENVPGVGNVIADGLRYVERHEAQVIVIPSDGLTFTWDGNSGVVVGTVSDSPTLASVVGDPEADPPVAGALDSIFSEVDTARIVVRDGIESERNWLPTVLTLVREVHAVLPVGSVFVNGDAELVEVAGELDTLQSRVDLRVQIEDTLSALPTFDWRSGLTVKEAPPPAPVEEIIGLQETLDDLIDDKVTELELDSVVEFELDSDVITEAGRVLLDEIAATLQLFPTVPVEIAGHTDDRGADAYNLELSRRRAQAVLDYLVDLGDDPSRFAVVGYGETRPIADNETAEGRARNRRIEFTALED
ncbi:MAG: OmpA family protein [Acidimicrobiia bacterium]